MAARPTRGSIGPSGKTPRWANWQNYAPQITFDGIEMGRYYNCPGMVADKTAFALQMGLGGVMIFPLNADRPHGNPLCLTDAIRRTIEERVE